jgi:hypothetical protein
MSDNTFSADPDALERGGVKIKELATLIESIAGPLLGTTGKYGALDEGGGDDYAKSLRANYTPVAKDCEDFMRGLQDLFGTHGDKTKALGGAFNDLDSDTTSAADSSSGGHRH